MEKSELSVLVHRSVCSRLNRILRGFLAGLFPGVHRESRRPTSPRSPRPRPGASRANCDELRPHGGVYGVDGSYKLGAWRKHARRGAAGGAAGPPATSSNLSSTSISHESSIDHWAKCSGIAGAGPVTLTPQPSTLNPSPQTPDPQPLTLHPKPPILSPKP
jgi:hypothetical protein